MAGIGTHVTAADGLLGEAQQTKRTMLIYRRRHEDCIDESSSMYPNTYANIVEASGPVLEESYCDHSQMITMYFTTTKQPTHMNTQKWRVFKNRALRYRVQHKHLFRHNDRTVLSRRLIDSEADRERVLAQLHDGGYGRREETYKRVVADRDWWETLAQDFKRYV